ncbi:unnamed protein product [Spirodela intermedia]|uniref:Uncharacterized protein n=1 Tax=Spirodela intermedia TaxID=51605 RepID=A0A7I8I9X4_SPIIN|nr:unnamed protein product [Spirodela intermedia]CAA6654516.1 unnamed protein product [Spirodela intermedia]
MQHRTLAVATEPPDLGNSAADAPPKQVARAMDRLGRAARLVADVRLGADRLLEALLTAEEPRQANKSVQFILKEEASMRQHLQDLRTLGRQLEESGVLSGSLKSRGNSWGLHMPLVCPDGAVVAYAWKRQLAGQAGASAVDRTRLALKAFSDQKRRYFPHLEDEPDGQPSTEDLKENHVEGRTLFDILVNFSKEVPDVRISTYQRMEWLKRASSRALSADENPIDPPKDQYFHSSDKYRAGSLDVAASGQAAVIELLAPSIFRAILSLHPAGSTNPDAVAFFSPDEGGNHVNSRGVSSYQVYRHITEHAEKTSQYFLSVEPDAALPRLLRWICGYQTLFSQACSKCGRLLTNDRLLNLLLPPVLRPHQQQLTKVPSHNDQKSEQAPAYHVGCYTDEV